MTTNTPRFRKHVDRREFIGSSDARTIMGKDESALLRQWREKRGDAEPEDLSSNPHPIQPCDRASTEPSTNPIRGAHAEFVAALTGHSPRPIPLDADALDLEDRADHLNKVLSAVSIYVTAVVDDTAQNAPGKPDLGHVGAVLSDLAADVTGAIRRAAGMAGRIA